VATLSAAGLLSRQWYWRDNTILPRHCVAKPNKGCFFHLVAWQLPLVAPLPMARQAHNSPDSYLPALPSATGGCCCSAALACRTELEQ